MRGENMDIAKDMLCKTLYHDAKETVLIGENNPAYNNSRNYNVAENNICIGASGPKVLYIENWNIIDDYEHDHDHQPETEVEARVFLLLSEEDRDLVNNDIWSGKTMLKDGRRAKALTTEMHVKYSAGLTFWWDDDRFWACLPTDEEAVMWMLNQ